MIHPHGCIAGRRYIGISLDVPPQPLIMCCLAAAWSVDISVGILWREADAGALPGSSMSGSGLVQGKLLRNGGEELSHVLSRLGRRLEEEEAGLAGIGLGICAGDGSLIGLLSDQIELVTGKGNDDVLVGLALEFLYPRLGLV